MIFLLKGNYMIENLTCVPLVNDISCVTGLDPAKLAFLHTLELRGNKLETTAGITLPTLKNLFLVRFLWNSIVSVTFWLAQYFTS